MRYVPPFGAPNPDDPYVDDDPALEVDGSIPPAEFFNAFNGEVVFLITDSGLTPDAGDLTQVAQAVDMRIDAALGDGGYLAASTDATLSAGFYTTPAALAIDTGTVTPVFAGRNVFTLAVTEAITLADPAVVPAGGMAVIYATQDATGGHGMTWGSAYRVAAGSWSTDANAVNILWLTFDGGAVIDVVIAQRREA